VDQRGEKLSKQTGAAPVDAHDPLPALVRTLRFLGHPPPPDASAGGVDELWRWALSAWRLERVPRERTRPVPENFRR
jgi:glutamyl-Q tRNA(Asp) synthetase